MRKNKILQAAFKFKKTLGAIQASIAKNKNYGT